MMKKIVLSTLFWVLCSSLIAQEYTIMRIKNGTIQKNGTFTRPNDKITSTDKVEFSGKTTCAILLNKARKTFIIESKGIKYSSIISSVLKPCLSEQSKGVIDSREALAKFFIREKLNQLPTKADSIFAVIGNELQIQIPEHVYKLNEKQFFYVRYVYNGKQQNIQLDFRKDTLILTKQKIYEINQNLISPLKMKMFYYDASVKPPVSYPIVEFMPVFVELSEFRSDVDFIIDSNKNNPTDTIINEVSKTIYSVYGNFDNFNLLYHLKKEFQLK